MTGKFYPFDPKGSQFYYPQYESQPPPPSKISLSALSLKPGDYIGLRGTGTWKAHQSDQPRQRMSGMFRDGHRNPLAPAPSGQEMPFDNWTPLTGQVISYAEDFDIHYDRTTIVRVPSKAVEIILNSGDWKFSDNIAGANCGVLVTLPNKKKSVPSVASGGADEDANPSKNNGQQMVLPAYPSPTATSFSSGPFRSSASADSKPQWRGWYQSGWKPQWSYWHASRPNSTHKGWDIFAPTGSKLLAPVGPCYLKFHPVGTIHNYGNVAAFYFSKSGKQYVAIYAHCSGFIGTDNRTINIGDAVAYSGCTDVSSCGTELTSGGRTDHVHFGLYEGQTISDLSGKPIDPATFFNWSPVVPTKANWFAAEFYRGPRKYYVQSLGQGE